ncbi:tetratricopeptide repeat protein [Vreelandella gomseomensis]|uniref:Tetratricopeptide repeat protein n=1 Tax=Vreelandella gomseomensis TaxID=370766 RepID=A0ABU1GAA6_9GAMM|nr:tetratricopeptide repeat protein [Halomonas gomseomensis]MDR5874420.1 tetratricopeptide repeat protein [Halomonas gomseomensis]
MRNANPKAPAVLRQRRLIRPLTLRLMALALALMLVVLFPAHHLLTLDDSDSMPSRISLLYSQALLNTDPDNVELRVNLANKLLKVGDAPLARTIMLPLQDSDDRAIQWLRLSIEWQLLAAIGAEAPQRPQALRQFQNDLQAFQANDYLSDGYLERMAGYWLAIEDPAQAATLYERLAGQEMDRQYHWLSLAGYWWLRAGYPERSAAAWHRAYRVAEAPRLTLGWLGWLITPAHAQQSDDSAESPRRAAALEALRSAQQSQQDDGVAYAREYLAAFPDDRELLDLGIRLALAHDQPLQALSWSQRLIDKQTAPDTKTLERHVSIALGLNELSSALTALDQLRRQHPNNTAYLERLTQVQQWSGDAAGALQNAEQLARQTGDEDHNRWVISLALDVRERGVAISALSRLDQQRQLTLEDRRLWADLLEQLGDPDAAIARIQDWQAGGIDDEALSIRLATWLGQTGRLDEAADSWAALNARYGARPAFLQAQHQVMSQTWQLDNALKLLGQPTASLTSDAGIVAQRAELAWQQGDSQASLAAYQTLFEQDALDAEGASRLILVAADNDHLDLAMRVTEHRWTQARDGDALIQMLYLAQRDYQTPLTKTLLAMADQAPSQFAQSANYWGAVAQQALLQRQPDDAVNAYQRALELTTQDPGLRAGLLYALIAAGDKEALHGRLDEWQEQAAQTPTMMSAMADAHRFLGQLDQAIFWYALANDAGVLDAWQQIYHADALSQRGEDALAFNMRLAAFAELSPTFIVPSNTPLNDAQRRDHTQAMGLVADQYGPDSVRGWFDQLVAEGGADSARQASDGEWLFNANVAMQQPIHARYLLLRAQSQGHVSPAWQTLAVALEKNDRDTLEALLDSDAGRALSATDRLAVARQLDRRQDARTLARQLTAEGANHLRDSAALDAEMPHRLATHATYQRLGNLDIAAQEALYQVSGERLWGRLILVTRQLDTADDVIDSNGIHNERAAEVQLGWNGPRSDTSVTMGQLDTARYQRPYAGASQRWQATSRLAGTLYGEISHVSLINDLMRLLAVEDRIGAQLTWAPTARDTLILNASHIRLRSRETRDPLGDGFRTDAEWRHALLKGATRQLDLSLLAQHDDYSIDRLPDDIRQRLSEDAQLDDLLTGSSSFVGVGIALRRGDPESVIPLVASPRFEVALEAGYRLPDKEVGLNARVALGSRLFGNDSLSLSLEADQGSRSGGNTNLGVSLTYQYFLGH